MLIIMADNWLF